MSTLNEHPTRRFSSRVDDYVKYRPSYPPVIADWLTREGFLTPHSLVADIGSGTGLLAELFLERGNRVLGVEPNPEMRAAGERFLARFSQFTSIAATAEATTLPAASIELITAGQAFHWFDHAAARSEFSRVLRPGGAIALLWNDRLVDASPFLRAYEQLLREFSLDYAKVDHRQITDRVIADFFHPHPVTMHAFANRQVFDFPGLRGRLLSSSYAPPAGHPGHEPMLARLREIFDRHQEAGQVTIHYQTKIYVGRPN
jgi:SAM-dependent methyltransferase